MCVLKEVCTAFTCQQVQTLKTNVMDVAHDLSTMKKDQIQYLTKMLETVDIFKLKLQLKAAW
ncbi:hypothetical protein Pyn_23468 [Prunus yedoensis var. nudiflora]|uniref:Uncharacterized protein n=1 Tax=Prunus yedoensis var. nudiflora TaxID=2094558 RepID=A0A314UGQ6_PRUYE|nr:hypothetical protein Pyn_23468 [Prunus yedoensis var. nudiflora]